jgi:hypothetical protein
MFCRLSCAWSPGTRRRWWWPSLWSQLVFVIFRDFDPLNFPWNFCQKKW